MPPKKSNRSGAQQKDIDKISDLPPTKASNGGDIPKGASRVLNAMKTREEFRQSKKRKLEEQAPREKDSKKMRIQAGESLQHFNKRVEASLRPLFRTAVQSSRKAQKQTVVQPKSKLKPSDGNKRYEEDDEEDEDDTVTSPKKQLPERARAFASKSSAQPSRLNDIVQAPPDIKLSSNKFKSAASDGKSKAGTVVSMVQKARMEEERELAIKRYRELKATRQQQQVKST